MDDESEAWGGRPALPRADEPESAYELLQRGLALLAGRHHAQASIVLERAAGLEPARGSILEPLGRAYFMSGQLERARETFERSGGRSLVPRRPLRPWPDADPAAAG